MAFCMLHLFPDELGAKHTNKKFKTMRNNKNADGNFEYKWLPLPVSVRNKRRFVKWCERNGWQLYCGYDKFINLQTRILRNTEMLYLSWKNH